MQFFPKSCFPSRNWLSSATAEGQISDHSTPLAFSLINYKACHIQAPGGSLEAFPKRYPVTFAEEVLGLVWRLRTTGSEYRDIYVVRNWDTDQKVTARLASARSASLVLHIGHAPRIVQIGSRRSDAPADREWIEAQSYQVEDLMDYTVRDGYVFDGDAIRA